MDCSGRSDAWLLRNKLAVYAMVAERDIRFQLAGRRFCPAGIGCLGNRLSV